MDAYRKAIAEWQGRHGSCMACFGAKTLKRERGKAARAKLNKSLAKERNALAAAD